MKAQAVPSRENQVKAIFLFNFTQFVEWPPGTFSSNEEPLVIGILGSDPFGPYLEETISGEKINGHSIIITRYDDIEDVDTCHILFINSEKTDINEEMIRKLRGQNILTVSDSVDFLQQGGMIRFFNNEGKVKLEVNLESVKSANLVISSKLLRLMEIFTPRK